MELPRITDFDVLEKLGTGAYATVYKARNKKKGTYHAIKCVEMCSLSGSARDNLITEIRLLRDFKHKFIVTLEDFFWDDKKIYIVLEYCNAGNLSNFIRTKKTLPEATCKYFMRQLATAVQYMRSNNVCHFDLKPQNLLLTRTAHNVLLKVADFGFAQHLKLGEMNEQIKGSPLYMAPEIVCRRQYDAKADLWSIGVILYECLFGRAPYSSKSIEELLQRIYNAERISFPAHVRISADCQDLLRRLLEHDPAQRISFNDFFAHAFLELKTFPTQKSLEKAVEIVAKAVVEDEKKNYKEAYYLYCNALQYFVPLLAEEADATKRSSLRKRICVYLKRAEELKNSLIEVETKQVSTVTATNVKTTAEAIEPNTRYKQLFALSHSSPDLKSALEIGRKGEMYLYERNFAAALESYTCALAILVPFLNNEPKGERRILLLQQMDLWMKEAESIKSILSAKDIDSDEQKLSSSVRSCSIQ